MLGHAATDAALALVLIGFSWLCMRHRPPAQWGKSTLFNVLFTKAGVEAENYPLVGEVKS